MGNISKPIPRETLDMMMDESDTVVEMKGDEFQLYYGAETRTHNYCEYFLAVDNGNRRNMVKFTVIK